MKNCIICGSEEFCSIYNKLLKKCKICGFVTSQSSYESELLNTVYNGNYFTGNEYSNYLNDKAVLTKNFEKRLIFAKRSFKEHKPQVVLEVGCAYGFFGELFVKYYPQADYTGFDVSQQAVEYACKVLKLNVSRGDILKHQPQKMYSDVFMWDVIEHLQQPELVLEKVSSLTQTNGLLHITTGNFDSFLSKRMKQNWRLIHLPTHLHYFSEKTIKLLLNNYSFLVEKIVYQPVYRSLRQTFFSLFILNKERNTFIERIYRAIPAKIFFPLNTHDIMYVVARKI